ncbi:MAG: FMN-binding protein [Thermoguttaceae bacterium]|nr:FMN-binding protein [Thermoguttaceae bacterium]
MKLSTKTATTAIRLSGAVVVGLVFAALFNGSSLADEIILTTGKKGAGTIVSETATSVEIETTVAGRVVKRTVPKNRIYSIEQNGKRRVLNDSDAGRKAAASDSVANVASSDAGKRVERAPDEVFKIIDRIGKTAPDWLESTPLEYPPTLDLSFPKDVDGWDANRNFGQYVWDVINPNRDRWKSAVKLAEFLRERNANDAEVVRRIDQATGEFYFRFFQDYARAAYYWRLSGLDDDPASAPWLGAYLGECYWRLGSKEAALDVYAKTPDQFPWIKVLTEMGELDEALKLAERLALSNRPDYAFVYAGDACRAAGDYDKAIEYYRRVLAVEATPDRTVEQMERNTKRARANIIGIETFERLDLTKVPNGVYFGDGVGFAGNVRVKVVVSNGKIASVEVVEHQEKQYYSSIVDVPRQIVEKQSLKDVDAVSSATATSEAIVNATAKALSEAVEKERDKGARSEGAKKSAKPVNTRENERKGR